MGKLVSNGIDYTGGGSSVTWTQIQATGEKIAEITINGTTTDVLIPFVAKIIVTTTTGLTVTATKGGTTYTATETSTGVYEVTVDSKGTWTVTDGTNTTTVSVTAQTTYNVAFVVIPDGSTVTPTDDIQTWLNCANIWNKPYTTLAEVLADTTTLSALISDNNATDYLVRSTDWVGVSSLAPIMTSNTTPSGKCGGSTVYPGRDYYNAFDGVFTDGWNPNNGATNNYLYYKFTEAKKVSGIYYTLYGSATSPSRTFTIKGSNDGSTWSDGLGTVTLPAGDGTDRYHTGEVKLNNSDSYLYYGFFCSETLYVGGTWIIRITEVQFYSEGLTTFSTAMTYIGLNNYCANKLLADATWRTAICNSTYFESVLNVKVPVMTSNTTPSGECFADSSYSGRQPYYAFDGNNNTYWSSSNGRTPARIGYKFTEPIRICAVKVTPRYNDFYRLKNYKVEYSTDNGVTWTTLLSHTYVANDGVISSNNEDIYAARWSIYCVDSYGADGNELDVAELQFYGREDV